ncbi:MAG: hypothetical protein EXR71_18650 [Myxococcales bacterium]|nr:hypothetical protein [Myxococcales bacterium]
MFFFAFACTVTETPSALTPGPADPAEEPEADCRDLGVVYEVYVRSFQDSDGDGVGDLDGLRSRLDHVVSLGVDTLWLMPIFPAFGPAGYDVTDFSVITAEYGDLDELDALVEAAHARGITVLVDLPFNHVDRGHPWFVAAEAGDAEMHRRFVYADVPQDDERWFPSAAGGWYYGYFGRDLPDLDYTDAGVLAEMARVWDHWLDHVDGFRLDAVVTLVEEDGVVEGSAASHEALATLLDGARAAHPESCFVAEASEWEAGPAASWLHQRSRAGADRVLDFVRLDALVTAARQGEATELLEVLAAESDARGAAGMATFLGSHDLPRLPAQVPDAAARRALRVVQWLLPGTPVIYYGEELDLADATSGTGQDLAMRAPMPWDAGHAAGFTTGTAWFTLDDGYLTGANVADQNADPASPLAFMRALGCLHREYALSEPDRWRPVLGLDPALLMFRRTSSAGELFLAVNLSARRVDGGSGKPDGLFDLGGDAEAIGVLDPWEWRVYGSLPTSCALG